MRPIWKWIIGIAVGLVVLAVIAGGVWAVTTRFAMMRVFVQNVPQVAPSPNTPNNPNTPNTPNGPYYGQRGMGPWMMPYGDRDYPRMPMMGRGGGFSPLRLIGGLIGVGIGLVALIILLSAGGGSSAGSIDWPKIFSSTPSNCRARIGLAT